MSLFVERMFPFRFMRRFGKFGFGWNKVTVTVSEFVDPKLGILSQDSGQSRFHIALQ